MNELDNQTETLEENLITETIEYSVVIKGRVKSFKSEEEALEALRLDNQFNKMMQYVDTLGLSKKAARARAIILFNHAEWVYQRSLEVPAVI